jgi:hypothetical protein
MIETYDTLIDKRSILTLPKSIPKMIKFYIYAYLDTSKPGIFNVNTSIGDFSFNYLPVYIGKGHNERMEKHIKGSHNKKLNDLIVTNKFETIQLAKNLNEAESYRVEAEIIYKIGREDLEQGPLFNRSEGVYLPNSISAVITPYNLELNKLILIIKALNTYSIKEAAEQLEISERSLYRHIKGYKLTKVKNSWIQVIND